MNSSKRTFFAMLALTILLVVAAGGITYLGLGMLHKKGDELTSLKTKQEILKTRQTDLDQAKQDIEKYAELEKISKAIVPQEKDQAQTVFEIVAIAQESRIPLESIQFPASELGAISSKKTSGSKSAAPKVDPNKTQLTLVPGTTGLYAMEITVQSNSEVPVPYSSLLTFLEKLEQNRRTAHVINLSIEPSKENRNLMTFAVTLNVYIKP